MPRKYETIILCFNEGKLSWNAGENRSHAASDNLRKGVQERELFLVQPRIFRDTVDGVGAASPSKLTGNVADEKFVGRDGQTVSKVELREVRELACKLMSKTWT